MGQYDAFLSDQELNIDTLHRDASRSPIDRSMTTLNTLKVPSMSLGGEDSDFLSDRTADRESDEDFCIGDDDGNSNAIFLHKKRRKKRKKRKVPPTPSTPSAPQPTASKAPPSTDPFVEGKNPVFTTTDPARFWSKFKGYIEPVHPQDLRTLFPHLQADAYPVQIPPLPMHKNGEFVVEDDVMAAVPLRDRSLYFAEMPTLYESFRAEKSYLDEQRAIEDVQSGQGLIRRDPVHQEFPTKSTMGHSFDQRALSCIVSGCGGMWSFEKEDLDANHWDKIGNRSDHECAHSNNSRQKVKGKHHGQNGSSQSNGHHLAKMDVSSQSNGGSHSMNGHLNGIGNGQSHSECAGDEDGDDMIEPVIRYETVQRKWAPEVSFEESIRNQICRHFFHSDRSAVDAIVSMPWQDRQDDECCAVIKSLQDAMQQKCYEEAPNDIETNVEIANELIGIVEDQMEHRLEEFETLRQFDEHLSVIRKEHINSGLRVNMELLKDPQWKQYFEQKLSLDVDRAIDVMVKHPHVKTVQK